ncbi:hypothetical protein BVI434_4050008 [Burkholderia vietnamiensis]|nr:hypothetical protein BVI434_4050008 [Burkholderia vietnamiensis]
MRAALGFILAAGPVPSHVRASRAPDACCAAVARFSLGALAQERHCVGLFDRLKPVQSDRI